MGGPVLDVRAGAKSPRVIVSGGACSPCCLQGIPRSRRAITEVENGFNCLLAPDSSAGRGKMDVCAHSLYPPAPRFQSADEALIANSEKVLLQRPFSPDSSLLSLA